MVLKSAVPLLVAACIAATPASAGWVYDIENGVFSGTIHFVLADSDGFGLLLRCKRDSDVVETVFVVTDESIDDTDYEQANAAGPTLQLKIDDLPVISPAAELFDMGGDGAADALTDKETLLALQEATDRVTVSIRIAGRNYYKQSFDLIGSAGPIERMMTGCGIYRRNPLT